MSKNHAVKSRKNKVALPPTTPGPLNVVTFSFRVVVENSKIQSRCVECAPLDLESRKVEKSCPSGFGK